MLGLAANDRSRLALHAALLCAAALGLALPGSTNARARAVAEPAPCAAGLPVLPGTEARELRSTITGHRYKIYTARPLQPPPAQGYAVVYVLDADLMFATMVETVRGLVDRPGAGVQPTLVVGIGYPPDLDARAERRLDLTPSVAGTSTGGYGGAEEFLRFITRELKPQIAARFPVDHQHESIFGHSFGGLFVLYALVNDPAAFDSFLAASPSIWFENRLLQKPSVRKRLGPKLRATQATPRVLITVGEYEQTPDPEWPANSAENAGTGASTLAQRAQVDNAREFAAFLAMQPGVAVRAYVLAGEDHGSVIPVAISRAARFALNPRAERAQPAARSIPGDTAPGSIPVPTATEYVALTADGRYQLRLRARRLPEELRRAWTALLDERLSAALTYGEHRRLHEEREQLDAQHGTAPQPGE